MKRDKMKQLINMIGNSFIHDNNEHALGIIIDEYKQSKQAIKQYDNGKPTFIFSPADYEKAIDQLKLNKVQTIAGDK
jgi:hypothetical protein